MLTAPPPGSPFEVLTPEQLRARSSLKWAYYGPEILPAWVAEMDLLPPPEVVDALTEAVRTGDIGYPGSGDFAYAEALGDFAAARWGWTIDVSHTVICADAMSGIAAVLASGAAAGGPRRHPVPGLSALHAGSPGRPAAGSCTPG